MTDEIPYYPLFLDDRPREALLAFDFEGAGSTEASAADVSFGDTYARTVGSDVPVAYVAWEEDGRVVGWLWWNDDAGALWKVSNYFEPAARLANGVDVPGAPPWVAELAASFAEGLSPAKAVQRLMSQPEDAEGRWVPPQDPQRARSLAHLREIAGESDWLAAAVRFRADFLLAAAAVEPDPASGPALAAEPDPAPESASTPEPAVNPAPAGEPEPEPTPAMPPAPRRRSWLSRLFGRR